jgi:DinB superfamily
VNDDASGLGEPDALRSTWSQIVVLWSDTISRAEQLPHTVLQERVDNEWSLVETLRHLVFVTDAWVRRTILSDAHAYHRLGLPPHFITDVRGWGIDVDAAPSFEDVYTARLDRMATVQQVVDDLTPDGFARTCDANPAPGFPPETTVTVARCLGIVMREEQAHHAFAVRDLAVLQNPDRRARRSRG